MSEEESNSNAAGIAFGLVLAAAAATCVGSSIVFFPSFVRFAIPRVLAFALALSAGVMIYISLIDIYTKAIDGFIVAGHDDGDAFIYCTLCFFGGMIMMMVLNRLVIDKLIVGYCGASVTEENDEALQLENIQAIANKTVLRQDTSPLERDVHDFDAKSSSNNNEDNNDEASEFKEEENTNDNIDDNSSAKVDEDDKLMKMGMVTALAIFLHNLPEGLLTFVGYMSDPTVGIVLSIGIALHNIPEGVCVALPIYYSTGNRCKAFWWGSLSGFSEPIGALIGWLALGKSEFSGNAYGVIFGIVAGIMVFIAVDGLIPSALRYDPKNTLVTQAFFLGMFIIATSLMMFSI